jgi:hypothetical protein
VARVTERRSSSERRESPELRFTMAELGHLLEAIHDAPRATSFFGSARTAVGGTVLPALWSVAVVGQ